MQRRILAALVARGNRGKRGFKGIRLASDQSSRKIGPNPMRRTEGVGMWADVGSKSVSTLYMRARRCGSHTGNPPTCAHIRLHDARCDPRLGAALAPTRCPM